MSQSITNLSQQTKTSSNHAVKKKKAGEYSITRGLSFLIGGVITYYVIPTLLLGYLSTGTISLPLDTTFDIQAFGIITGLVIFCVGYTPKGSRLNAAIILFQIGITFAYMWSILNGGIIDVTFQSISLHLEFGLIMYWILAIAVINALPYLDLLFNPKVRS